ncbi:hypothetical protein [Geoglobus acetivorans]|uniref:Delta-aminolevulinic acid dehydratase n=1 Tax=Geoglobus acetivorans TaxID=565033 RepID=A0ABZ3H2Y1_GEOAI|nr:hypothetical protein [Geoglobus acetivorans]
MPESWIVRVLAIQFNLYSPVNFRPVLGIGKDITNKSLLLFSRAYSYLFAVTKEDAYKVESEKLLRLVEGKRLKNSIGAEKDVFLCSSYYFKYIAPKHLLSPEIPDIICITEFIKSAVAAYEVLGRKQYLLMAKKGIKGLVKALLCEKEQGTYFKYTPFEENRIVFDVSGLALEAMSGVLRHSYNPELVSIGNKVVKLLVDYQRGDGAWPFSYDLEKRSYYWQLDYHQGFIIDGLLAFYPYVDGELKKSCMVAIRKGVEFFQEKQLCPEGYFYYRYPLKYPINIHNQAQGIITFANLYRFFRDAEYLRMAEKILKWTIDNMRDPSGYFYSHKWPGFVNKIPYMRWAQAWIMLAMSYYLYTTHQDKLH